jgi:putative hydrolase of the HAD superfamily
MVLIFDLDDTLYDEMSYVKSGFNAVAFHLSYLFKIKKKLYTTSY